MFLFEQITFLATIFDKLESLRKIENRHLVDRFPPWYFLFCLSNANLSIFALGSENIANSFKDSKHGTATEDVRMAGSPDLFESVSSGIKNIAMTIAIIVGGGWTLYVFNAQFSVQQAESTLKKLQMEIERQAALKISIKANQLVSENAKEKIVAGQIEITNNGNRNTTLVLKDGPIRIARIMGFDEEGEPVFGPNTRSFVYYSHRGPAHSKIILAGSGERLHFIASVSKVGLYSILFTVDREKADLEVAARAAPGGTSYHWTAQTFVDVK